MKKEAEENAEADEKRKEEVDLKNDVDQLLFQTDKTLKDVDGKVPEEDVKKVKDAQEAQENNLDDMKQKRDDLNKLVQDMTVKLYENAQKNQQAQGGATSGAAQGTADDKKSDDDTINGDYKDVSDDDKK